MSLTTLTFGSGSNAVETIGKGKIRVIKAEKFVGMEAICVIAKLTEGVISKKMAYEGKQGSQVVSVESKYGDGFCTKEGAQVVLMVMGTNKSDYETGSEITFVRDAAPDAKPKGRIIIA